MSSSQLTDPLLKLRKAVTKLEAGGNALANRAMDSSEFSSALHQLANLSLGMQQTFEKALGTFLKRINLPSRAEVMEISEALRRIESKLDRLLPIEVPCDPPSRPARTRLPPDRKPALAGQLAATAAKKRSDTKPRRRTAGG